MEKTKQCPYCGEEVLATAKKCRYCGEWFKENEEVKKNTIEFEEKMEPVVTIDAPKAIVETLEDNEVKSGFFQYYWGEVCRKHLFDFKGKLGRKDYWCAVIALFTTQFSLLILSLVGSLWGSDIKMLISIGAFIGYLVLNITSMALAVRRLHDIGRSGWWLAINLIPFVGSIIFLVMLCKPGETPSHRVKSNLGDWVTLGLLLLGLGIWLSIAASGV